ncbi:DUF547 domain-containing protein [Litorivivens sp.]|uniref:DUF547 domain-containing protein n=1 Tax=Litorivivens sp. TaxID=2020868 RepID=UPI003561616F
MKHLVVGLMVLFAWSMAMAVPRSVEVDQATLADQPAGILAANFVDRVIHDLPVDVHLSLLKGIDPDSLESELDSQQKQLAFWLNIYNGFTQYLLKTDPSLYQQDRSAFFGKEQIAIAGFTVSMDDIEHGVLRRGAVGFSLGFIRNLSFRKPFIRQFAVTEVDYRIHFALNCGARSCPPVMVYQAQGLDRQLDDNSRYYLQKEVRFESDKNRVYVPALLNWFKADFGSTDDQRAMLVRYGVLPEGTQPKIRFLDYDWTMEIENYRHSDLVP